MVGTISFVQTAVDDLLYHEMADPDQARRAAIAWEQAPDGANGYSAGGVLNRDSY